ncbi:MAG TPA: small ribosomal subunit Rsm22 family protein [Thermodesulfobacteriota bacterium]
MELPDALREAVDRALEGVPLPPLARAAAALSRRYRAEVRDGTPHVADDLSARAYLATRLPATYAAVRASLAAVAEARPDFAPRTVLDVGAGPGSALWAAAACWPGLEEAVLIEGSAVMRGFGERLSAAAPVARVAWRPDDAVAGLPDLAPRDLVLLAYVLGELPPEARGRLVDRLWSLAADTLLIVEPGTPAGWTRVLAARDRLIAAGAHVLAPCPHAARCPVSPPDWCHFARRVARSRVHLRAKGAAAPWEDEKYIYVAVSRRPGIVPEARIVAPRRSGGGHVRLKLCRRDGAAAERLVRRRDGDAFRTARRLDWGDALSVR